MGSNSQRLNLSPALDISEFLRISPTRCQDRVSANRRKARSPSPCQTLPLPIWRDIADLVQGMLRLEWIRALFWCTPPADSGDLRCIVYTCYTTPSI